MSVPCEDRSYRYVHLYSQISVVLNYVLNYVLLEIEFEVAIRIEFIAVCMVAYSC